MKGLIVNVYRYPGTDCTCNGLSSKKGLANGYLASNLAESANRRARYCAGRASQLG